MILDGLLHNPYWAIVPLSVVEGPIAAVGCGVGAALGYVDPFLAFAALMAGSLIQDLIYYGLGRWAAGSSRMRDFATRRRLLRSTMAPIEAAWRGHMVVTLLTLKFAYGLYAPFLVTAGFRSIPLIRLLVISMAWSALALIAWIAIGYGLTRFWGMTGHFAPYLVGAIGVGGLLAMVLVIRRARRRLDPERAARSP